MRDMNMMQSRFGGSQGLLSSPGGYPGASPFPPGPGPGLMPGGGGAPGASSVAPPSAIGPANLANYGTGRFGKMFRGRGMGGGMGAGAMSFGDVPPPGAGEDAGAGDMGWGGMHALEKAFLITSALSSLGDIGGSIYDRQKQSKDEERDREDKARAGRSIGAALSRPRV